MRNCFSGNRIVNFESHLVISEAKSAFTVTNTAAVDGVSGEIRFTRKVTDPGDHYNTTSGEFVAEYSGLYVFVLNVYSAGGKRMAWCFIRKNGANMMNAESYVSSSLAGNNFGSSNTAVLQLDKGDIVDLGECTVFNTFKQGWQTSFSGFLLQEEEEVQ